MPESVATYAPIGLLVLIVLFMTAATMVLAHVLGPRRMGPAKSIPYESGVDPIGGARKRFNVRFYLVAVLFLLFDVELFFLYPAAPILMRASGKAEYSQFTRFVGIELLVFFAILVLGWYYERKRGII